MLIKSECLKFIYLADTRDRLMKRKFMSDYVSEMKALENDWLLFGDVTYSIMLHSIICDAPAAALGLCKMH